MEENMIRIPRDLDKLERWYEKNKDAIKGKSSFCAWTRRIIYRISYVRNNWLIYSLIGKELKVAADCSLNMKGQCRTRVKKKGEKSNFELYKQEHSLQNALSISSVLQPWKGLS